MNINIKDIDPDEPKLNDPLNVRVNPDRLTAAISHYQAITGTTNNFAFYDIRRVLTETAARAADAKLEEIYNEAYQEHERQAAETLKQAKRVAAAIRKIRAPIEGQEAEEIPKEGITEAEAVQNDPGPSQANEIHYCGYCAEEMFRDSPAIVNLASFLSSEEELLFCSENCANSYHLEEKASIPLEKLNIKS